MRDKAKVLLIVFIAMSALSGCAASPKPHQEALKLSEPLVIASALSLPDDNAMTAYEAVTQDLRIKIVSGDGMPLSAKIMSRELTEKGYRIDRVDVAPFLFKEATVFYAPGFHTDARELADIIKAQGGIKPLSWKSIYDIIIVSVKQ